MLLKKPTNKPLYTSCTGMLLIGLNDALLVPISWAGMEGAKGGFAVAQTEAAGPLLLFGVPMPWPIHCHAILQKGSSLKKMEMLKGLYTRAVKVFRPALTETDNIYCVSVCQMRYVQGDFNFRQLSSYFVMISGMAKEKKKPYKRKPDVFVPAGQPGGQRHTEMETRGALLPAPSPSCTCATPCGDAALAPLVMFSSLCATLSWVSKSHWFAVQKNRFNVKM